jgi:hypothetical protein
VAAMTRRRPAAAGPIPGRSVPPGPAWGVFSEGHLPAHRRPAVPTREHQSGGQPTHAAPARHADHRARPPPANRPSVDDHRHHDRGAQARVLTLTAVPTSERFLRSQGVPASRRWPQAAARNRSRWGRRPALEAGPSLRAWGSLVHVERCLGSKRSVAAGGCCFYQRASWRHLKPCRFGTAAPTAPARSVRCPARRAG